MVMFIVNEALGYNVAYVITGNTHLGNVEYLEKIFEGGVDSGVGNKRQGVVRQKLCCLAQCCPPSLQVLLEVENPLLKLSSVLETGLGFQVF